MSENPHAIPLIERHLDKVHWRGLSENPHAIHLIERHLDKVHWRVLSRNPNAIHILEHNLDKVNWRVLSRNPNAIHILEQNPVKIHWDVLCQNPNAMPLLKKRVDNVVWYEVCKNPHCVDLVLEHLHKPTLPNLLNWAWEQFLPPTLEHLTTYWDPLCLNTSPKALKLLEQNIHKINWSLLAKNPNAVYLIEQHIDKLKGHEWSWLSKNPSAVPLLERHLDKVDWIRLSSNPSPDAIHFLEKHQDLLNGNHRLSPYPNWGTVCDSLSQNPNAVNLLKNNLHKLSYDGWTNLAFNPNVLAIIGKLNTTKMKDNCRAFACELAEKVFHPSRLLRMCEAYGMDLEDYIQLI